MIETVPHPVEYRGWKLRVKCRGEGPASHLFVWVAERKREPGGKKVLALSQASTLQGMKSWIDNILATEGVGFSSQQLAANEAYRCHPEFLARVR